jgi:hypothetical protein
MPGYAVLGFEGVLVQHPVRHDRGLDPCRCLAADDDCPPRALLTGLVFSQLADQAQACQSLSIPIYKE